VATHEHHADQLSATAQNDQMIIPIDQDPQATVFDNLHEPIGIVPETMVPRGDAPGNRDRAAVLIQVRVGLADCQVQAALVPADQPRELGAAQTA
jgi:hypothetical protein